MLALLLLAVLASHVLLARAYLFGDEHYYLTESYFTSRGMLIYRDFFDNHSPGIAYIGLAALLFRGQELFAARLIAAAAQVAAAALVFAFAARAYGEKAGLAAAFFYASLELSVGGIWFITEPFLAAACAASALLAWEYFSAGRRAGFLFAAGLLAGLAVLFKQPALLFAVFLPAYAIWRRAPLRDTALLAAGILLPILCAALFFLANGALQDAAYGTVLFNLTVKGVRDADVRFQFYQELAALVPFFVLLLLMAWRCREGRQDALAVFLLGWAVSACAVALPRYVGYHLMAAFPPVAIFLGGLVRDAGLGWNLRAGAVDNALRLAVAYILLAVVLLMPASIIAGGALQRGQQERDQVADYLGANCNLSRGLFGFPGFGGYYAVDATPATYYLEFSPWLVNDEVDARTVGDLERKAPDCVAFSPQAAEYLRSEEITPGIYSYLKANYAPAASFADGSAQVLRRRGT